MYKMFTYVVINTYTGDISSISGSEDSNEDTDDNEDDTNMSTTEKMKKKVNDKMRHIRKTAESGSSESETESSVQVVLDDAGRRYPKLFFRSTDGDILSVYRCIVYHKKVILCFVKSVKF